jgi:hypothetical protein
MVPERFRNVTSLRFEQGRWVRRAIRLTEESALLCDSWRLNDGRDVRHGDTSGGYYAQVNRIFLINRDRADAAIWAMEAAELAVFIGGERAPSASEPVLVSLNHHTGSDGRVRLNVDGGRAIFDTTPLTVPHSGEDGEEGSRPYQDTLNNRGDNFMGCEEPMNATCGAGLGTENPFGDGVHWPPADRGE